MTKGRQHRYIAALALAFALVAGVAGGAFARERPPIKSIGIVSDIGDKVRLQHIGFMVFGNSLVEKDIPEWRIDAFMTGELEAGGFRLNLAHAPIGQRDTDRAHGAASTSGWITTGVRCAKAKKSASPVITTRARMASRVPDTPVDEPGSAAIVSLSSRDSEVVLS